jgi:hypothetical protein
VPLFATIAGLLLLSLCGYANAVVVHPEDTAIVALLDGTAVCFNNDGALESTEECDNSGVDEGLVFLDSSNWQSNTLSGINYCEAVADSPVSSVSCTTNFGIFASCQANEYVLLQTTKSGHYFAVKADASCTTIAVPESTSVVPCRSTDAFDSLSGCVPGNPPVLSVEKGYFQLNATTGPPGSHCTDVSHRGRMAVDGQIGLLYICTQAGWAKITPDQ